MSSTNRTAQKGGKGSKGDSGKAQKHDKSDTGKGTADKQQHNAVDSLRTKDEAMMEKVRQLMEMTLRKEEEVCLALQECDNDTEQAVNMLFENKMEGEWEKSSKKRKNRQTSTSKVEPQEAASADDWDETPTLEMEKPRNKSGGPSRLHGRHNDSRGWKGRENKENEHNLDDAGQRRERRGGRPGGPNRGATGRGGRGGGRPGSRYPSRGGSRGSTRRIDTWDNNIQWEATTHANHTENWDDFPQPDDWSTEEYTGSLADTKVFTPSSGPLEGEVVDASPELANAGLQAAAAAAALVDSPPQQLAPSMDLRNPLSSQIVGTLNAAQTQYLNQLTQQNSDSLKTGQYQAAPTAYGNASQSYTAGQTYANSSVVAQQQQQQQPQYNATAQAYGSPSVNTFTNTQYPLVNNTYADAATPMQQQTTRTKTQRARVPPPSKIPASAVEMPGDINNSIAYLDVQFGAMDFMSEGNTYEGISDNNKYGTAAEQTLTNSAAPTTTMDLSQAQQPSSTLDAYSTSKATNPTSISSALSQGLNNSESIPQTSEHLSASYNSVSRNSNNTTVNATQSAQQPSVVADLNKQTDSHAYSQPSTYNSYQTKSNANYQSTGYNSSNYSAAQTTTSNYANSATSYNTPNSASAYLNSYSNSYQGNSGGGAGLPSISQSSSYPNQYQQSGSQSVYGASTGLNTSSNFGNTSSANQYSSYNANSKLGKESGYENSIATTGSTTTASSATSASLAQTTTASGSKSTTTSAKNTSNVMSNIPPGVPPVMTTPYIVGQLPPYFQQPIYSFEDMQLLQQRMPHMTTGYYDMSYQTPTTLTAVRDGSLANVAYSISDGRFTRGDSNTSPVPSTISQQSSTMTQAHQAAQPLLAPQAATTPFFYAATYNPMQPTYQFGAVYPQLPTVTNAHGSNNSSQYPKPGTYGSGYGSTYDPLTQSQDYSKGAYVNNAQGQSKGSGANTSAGGSGGSDLAMYGGKSHTALGKVNSYDKQGFHSGTPPPFAGALHGNQSTGLAPNATGYAQQMFIPAMAPHQQHHSTQLMHQPLHQMEVRHQGRRMDSGNSSGQRAQSSNPSKSGGKQPYPASYWNQS